MIRLVARSVIAHIELPVIPIDHLTMRGIHLDAEFCLMNRIAANLPVMVALALHFPRCASPLDRRCACVKGHARRTRCAVRHFRNAQMKVLVYIHAGKMRPIYLRVRCERSQTDGHSHGGRAPSPNIL